MAQKAVPVFFCSSGRMRCVACTKIRAKIMRFDKSITNLLTNACRECILALSNGYIVKDKTQNETV